MEYSRNKGMVNLTGSCHGQLPVQRRMSTSSMPLPHADT